MPMPILFWGFLAIVTCVLGLALIALRPQAKNGNKPEAHARESTRGLWWATDVGSGDCSDGDCD